MPASRVPLLAGVVLLLAAAPAAAAPRRPNVVIMVADDLGYADVGFQGCRDIPTPRLDALAAGGVRLSAGYVSGPYCSPTRAGLLTGRYQQRFGHEFNPGPPGPRSRDLGLPTSERTLADVLRAAGYRTGLVGKWHLGHGPGFVPQARGFEETFGFLGGAHPYLPEEAESGPNALRRGGEPVREEEYLTRAFAREAESFIERHAGEPFFLYLAFNAVHAPLQAPADAADRFAAVVPPRRRPYAAMLAELDAAVGRVLDALDRAGVAEETLVVFFSDNGGPGGGAAGNGPLRGFKASTWEGGIRVPFVLRWPGRLPAGTTYAAPVIQLDIFPTALAAAGVEAPAGVALDGVDLLPHLTGAVAAPPHERLLWRFGTQWAIREGDWKLVVGRGAAAPLLVNLSSDPGETTDLSDRHPDTRQALEAAWRRWDAGLEAPRWPDRAATKRAPAAARPRGGAG